MYRYQYIGQRVLLLLQHKGELFRMVQEQQTLAGEDGKATEGVKCPACKGTLVPGKRATGPAYDWANNWYCEKCDRYWMSMKNEQ